MAHCRATRKDGGTCGGNAVGETGVCRWHNLSEEMREVHRVESQKGGRAKAAAAIVATSALSTDPAFAVLDLCTPQGIKGAVGIAIAALSKLPFDVKVANAVGFLATSQRTIIETSDVVARMAAIEETLKTIDPKQRGNT